MGRMWCIAAIALLLAACSGPDNSIEKTDWEVGEENAQNQNNLDPNNVSANNVSANNVSANNVSANNVSANNVSANNVSANNITPGCLPHVPDSHRPDRFECDDVRGPGSMPDPADTFAECQTDADCSAGTNGRCIGNNHDSWYCSYDACRMDSECGTNAVCECEGGWRGDHNVCLAGNCEVDADCGGTGFCSPSQGDCGAYFGTVGYFCHTCDDECVNDSDCGDGTGDPFGSYCMFEPSVGHWRCSDSQCAG